MARATNFFRLSDYHALYKLSRQKPYRRHLASGVLITARRHPGSGAKWRCEFILRRRRFKASPSMLRLLIVRATVAHSFFSKRCQAD